MRVTVVGAGAIGGTTGALLHHAGHDVTLVDRDAAHVVAINENGLRISGYIDLIEPVPAITDAELVEHVEQHGPLGMVVLAVKAMDTEAAATMIAPLLAPDGFIVSYQNGLNEERIAPIVGPERTIGAFIHFGGDLMEPGHVVLANRVTTYLSELDGRRTPRIEEVARVLSNVTPVEITDNLNGYLWGKLCYAALGFAVSVVDAPVDEILETNPGVRAAVRGVVAEVVDVAHAQDLRLENIHGFDPNLFDRKNPQRIAETDRFFDEWAARGKNSIKRHMGIHRDIKVRKRRTEVDFQVGPVVERGRELGVPTPLLEQLVSIVHDVESGTRAQDWSTIKELDAAARAAGER
ncbi:MAG TPA: ketopantoate reductase family protein [Nitrolancea sp.]|nr:ketopantoate reductase family protein [Nitrolancea sp.]